MEVKIKNKGLIQAYTLGVLAAKYTWIKKSIERAVEVEEKAARERALNQERKDGLK